VVRGGEREREKVIHTSWSKPAQRTSPPCSTSTSTHAHPPLQNAFPASVFTLFPAHLHGPPLLPGIGRKGLYVYNLPETISAYKYLKVRKGLCEGAV
jgi:hypothetical protein